MRQLLNTLFVTSEDIYLSLDGENVVANRESAVVARYPLHTLSAILSFSYKGASPALMGACCTRGISLSFCTPWGKFLARATGEANGNVLLRRTQYRIADDVGQSCRIARYMVFGKVYNARWCLERIKRDHKMRVDGEVLAQTSGKLKDLLPQIAAEPDLEIVELCRKADMGFIAMKALSGGLITNSAAAYAYMRDFDHVLPIWGIQRESELDEFLEYMENPPVMTEEYKTLIEQDRKELSGNFCRGCGYCMPCPVGIEINTCARMSLLIRRSPSEKQLTPEARAMMDKVKDCLHCRACASKCPYGLDTPKLLEENYQDYQEILAGKAF